MSETTTETDSEGERIESIASLAAAVRELKEIVLGGQQQEPAAAEPEPKSAAAADTRRAVQEIARRDAAKQRREAEKAAGEKRFKALEDKVFEKPPVEHRKGFTGWWQKHNQWTDEKS